MNRPLNNKGMTLTELLVAITLVMVMIIGMFNLISNVRKELVHTEMIKSFNDYSNLINNKIHNDLIKNKPFAIVYKNEDNFVCTALSTSKCIIENESVTVSINNKTQTKNIKDICTNNCAIYSYLENNNIVFKSIILDVKGITYDDVLEVIPNKVKFLTGPEEKEDNKMYIKIDQNGFFVINYPFFDESTNYGFKIAYPFGE